MLTNGVNVGGRAGDPADPGALAAGAETLDVQAGQGLRLRLGNETVVRFFRLILTDNAGVQIPLVRVGGQGGSSTRRSSRAASSAASISSTARARSCSIRAIAKTWSSRFRRPRRAC